MGLIHHPQETWMSIIVLLQKESWKMHFELKFSGLFWGTQHICLWVRILRCTNGSGVTPFFWVMKWSDLERIIMAIKANCRLWKQVATRLWPFIQKHIRWEMLMVGRFWKPIPLHLPCKFLIWISKTSVSD